METKGKVLSVLGDSITAGANASRFELAYHQILKELGEFSRVNVYGVGGTRIARQKKPSVDPMYDEDFISRAEMIEHSDIIVVFGGTNDYGHGDAPLGEIGDKTEYTFCGACNILLGYLRKHHENATVVVLLPIHRRNDADPHGEDGKKPHAVATLWDYAKRLEEIATKFACPVCDLWADERLNPNVKENDERYFTDGLHPNDEGHAIIAKRLYEFIRLL